jgi:hypothetical protein
LTKRHSQWKETGEGEGLLLGEGKKKGKKKKGKKKKKEKRKGEIYLWHALTPLSSCPPHVSMIRL